MTFLKPPELPPVLDLMPPEIVCPDWCTTKKHRVKNLPVSLDVVVHWVGISPWVEVIRVDEWYAHEAARGGDWNRWRENPSIRLLRPDVDPDTPLWIVPPGDRAVTAIHQPHELGPLLKLGPLLLPGLLDDVRRAADLLGWEVPS